MSIMIEGFIGKQIYAKPDFKIYSFFPTTETKDLVNTNLKYGNISISGALPTMMEEVKYRLSIEESNNSKYANSYTVIKMFNDAPKDNNYKDKFLQTVVTEKQYETLKTVYPNIVDMIINNEPVDVSKLHGIGEKIMDKIIDKVKTDFVLVDIIGKYSDLGLTMNGLKKLYETYHSVELIDENMEKDPYTTLTRIARIGFKIADACLLKKYPYLIDSIKRGKSCIDFLLKQNETNGNTWLGYTNLYRQLKTLAPETSHHFQDIITNKEDYYYHDLSKRISLLTTYMCEKEVCNRLLDINSKHDILDINWEQYNEVDGFPLTEQQRQILKNVCHDNLNILVGYGGCVDRDTEYFNGTKWIKISEYKDGDNVLQFNSKDRSANLVKPKQFIKEPCETMWHFKTKYGLDQCLSNEHKIVYETSKGNINTRPFYEVKEMQERNKSGFTGKFLTTFNYNGEGIDFTNEEIRVMCAVICDGYFKSDSVQCVINIKKERKKGRLEKLLNEANISFKIWKSGEGYNKYIFNAPKREREFYDYWYSCSKEQIEVICDEILNWDGSVTRNMMRFCNTSEKTIDFIQFAFSSCGYRVVKQVDDRVGQVQISSNGREYIRKSICFNLSISKRNKIKMLSDERSSIGKTKIEEYKTKDGFKYCFVVPSDTLVLRRNGKIFITGNCGKTFSTKALVDMLEDNMLTYMLLSPTGRASKVLSDNTGRIATTIHRGLKYKHGRGFQYNLENKLPHDVIIIDEYSMIDIFLLRDLLRAIKDGTKIVFVGDPDQIPSVGCGNIAFDMLQSCVISTSSLTQVFRYGEGGLSYVATQIREGKYFLTSNDKMQTFGVKNDYTFINTNQTIPVVKNLYNKLITQKCAIPDDIMVLSAYNKGDYGTINLNKIIQEMVNPASLDKKQIAFTRYEIDYVFREGDKVMQIVNDYKMTTIDGNENPIMNGDIGKILKIEGNTTQIVFDGKILEYTKDSLKKLSLAYAISIHKSQGSQSKYVILVTPDSHSFFLNRNLMYVGVSRAEELVYHVGTIKVLQQALKKSENFNRDTYLEEMLTGDL